MKVAVQGTIILQERETKKFGYFCSDLIIQKT